MAITKLMHIKERKGNDPSAGLRNSINYILNEAKTENSYWVSSNCGDTAKEIYESMMVTKRAFLQISGRQGYHFVISFKPGEADELEAFNVAKKFCEDYLRDEFEYCTAVHNDKAHVHAHIVFNSVSRIDGHKYHYANGEWKTEIQPVTDQASIEFDLPPLEFREETKGLHYQDWKDGKSRIFLPEIRADFDAAIAEAGSYDEFLEILRKKYTVRTGFSRKRDSEYFSVFNEQMGMKNARRNYYLGTPYTVNSIKERIRMKQIPAPYAPLPSGVLVRLAVTTIRLDAEKKQPRYSRQQKRYLLSHWRIRKMQRSAAGGSTWKHSRESDRFLDELDYLISNRLFTAKAIEETEKKEHMDLALAYAHLKEKEEWFTPEEEQLILRYRELRKREMKETDPASRSRLREELRQTESTLPVRDLLDKYEELEEGRHKLEKKKREAARSLYFLADIRKLQKEAQPLREQEPRMAENDSSSPTLQTDDRSRNTRRKETSRPALLPQMKQEEVPK